MVSVLHDLFESLFCLLYLACDYEVADEPETQQREGSLILAIQTVVGARGYIATHKRAIGQFVADGFEVRFDSWIVRF